MASSSTPLHSIDTFEFASNPNGGKDKKQPGSVGRGNGNGYDLGEFVERTDSSASSTSSWDLLQQEPSTIVDLGSETPSEYDGSVNGQGIDSRQLTNEDDFGESMKAKIMEEVGGQVWAVGKRSATKFYNLYANIDVFRPYFDVEPRDVLKRLANSLIPRKPVKPQTVPGELYGPVMLVFTLIALLLFSMKSSGHIVVQETSEALTMDEIEGRISERQSLMTQAWILLTPGALFKGIAIEGTLMGTAIGVSFGYWIGGSGFYYFVAYLCNSHITFLQVLTLTGYGLFGHCLAIMITSSLYHNSHSTFYFAWMLFGGLSSLKMISVYISRTWSKKNGIVVASTVAAVHMLSLIYFHFAYHAVVEEAAMLLSRTKRGDVTPVGIEESVLQINIAPSALLTNVSNSILTTYTTMPSEAIFDKPSPSSMMLF